jgi:hypothetical protein
VLQTGGRAGVLISSAGDGWWSYKQRSPTSTCARAMRRWCPCWHPRTKNRRWCTRHANGWSVRGPRGRAQCIPPLTWYKDREERAGNGSRATPSPQEGRRERPRGEVHRGSELGARRETQGENRRRGWKPQRGIAGAESPHARGRERWNVPRGR